MACLQSEGEGEGTGEERVKGVPTHKTKQLAQGLPPPPVYPPPGPALLSHAKLRNSCQFLLRAMRTDKRAREGKVGSHTSGSVPPWMSWTSGEGRFIFGYIDDVCCLVARDIAPTHTHTHPQAWVPILRTLLYGASTQPS